MKRFLHTCIVLVLTCVAFIASATAQTLTGTVLDESNNPVIGATVLVPATGNGTITDISGNYTISKLSAGDVVEYSYIGMTKQAITYSSQTNVDITLKEDSTAIEDIVVVGFGSQKKVNLTGSVAVVDQEALQARPVTSAAEMLQGTVPGLNITNSSGKGMDDELSIDIRGKGTIGTGSKGSPLILIDGMEGDFNSLNPQDIESISVLKDAASSSIYGSRAPFGVILITTKSGKKGRIAVNYNNNFRISMPLNLPQTTDSYSFAHYINDAYYNQGGSAWFSDERIAGIKAYQNGELQHSMFPDPTKPEQWGLDYKTAVANVDHFQEAFQSSAFSQEHNVSVSGGSEDLNFYLSANYSDGEGLLKVNSEEFDRLTVTSKVNAKVYDWLSLNVTSRFSNRNYKYPTNMKRERFAWSNNLPNFFSNLGSWPTEPDYDPNGFPWAATQRDVGNAVFSLNGGDSKNRDKTYFQQIQAVIEPVKGWKTFIDYNYRLSDSDDTAQLINTYNRGVDGVTLYPVCTDSYVEEFRSTADYYNFNAYSEYTKNVNERHNFKGMVGFQYETSISGNITAKRDGVIVDDLISLDTTNGLSSSGLALAPSVGGVYNSWATAGFFGRLNYDYDGRYLFEGSLRYDGTSRFVGKDRWGLFPSGSFGWNVAREDFFEPFADKIGTFKLRASYGTLGNQNTNNLYPTYRTMNLKTQGGEYLIGGIKPTTTTEPGLIDPSLTWERIINWNFGLDVSALNNRLNLTADYFVRQTKDMVGPAEAMPETLGIAVPKANNTDLTTSGYEISLSWRDRTQGGFSYGVSVSLSDSKTVIDSYPNPNNLLNVKGLTNQYIAGRQVGEIWGYETIGIAKSQEEMDAHLASTSQSALGGNWAAGDIMYKDLNGDGKINMGSGTLDNHGDLKVIGNSTPRYALSFSVDAAYKGFDVRAFFQGVMKRDYWAGGINNQRGEFFWGAYNSIWETKTLVQHMDYFREDPNHALGQNLDSYYPRPTYKSHKYKNQQVQSRYLLDASYLRVKNLQVGYTIPQSALTKIGIGSCRVFVSGENLFTFTSLSEIYDPETISGGYMGMSYPITKTVSMGINVSF